MRRAVLILALRLPEPKPRRGHPASADTLARLRALPKADVPAFALTEPHPGATGFWEEVSLEALAASHTPAHLPHSVGTIGADGRGCGTLSLEDSDQFVEPGALIPRLAALQAALDAPEKQAKRMARWLTRQRRARETGPARLNPMRLGHPPTVTKARRHRFPKSTQALIDLHHFAQRVFDSS
ncbi:MAG: hypothetical protein QNI84_05210 [Henriciella sp.]|nr:hypothetical protein [Henriciella sp.]